MYMYTKRECLAGKIIGWIIIAVLLFGVVLVIFNIRNPYIIKSYMVGKIILVYLLIIFALCFAIATYAGWFKGKQQHIDHYANTDKWFVLRFFDKEAKNVYAYERGNNEMPRNIKCPDSIELVSEVNLGDRFIVSLIDEVYYLKKYQAPENEQTVKKSSTKK